MADPTLDSAIAAASAGGGFASVLLAGRWLIGWLTGRHEARANRLDAQEAKIDLEWQEIREQQDARIDDLTLRLKKIERDVHVMLLAYQHVSGALIRIDPQNEALDRAGAILRAVFPIDLSTAVARAEAALGAGDDERRAAR